MDDLRELFALVKDVTFSTCRMLCRHEYGPGKDHVFSETVPREMKAGVDALLEERILNGLALAGLPILSEEVGEVSGNEGSALKFVVDPLDGTVNYVRGLGPAAISIALCRDNRPIYGAIGVYPSGDCAWGGKGLGAFLNGESISVSSVGDPMQAVLCTGFPARFELEDGEETAGFISELTRYGKVRMLGAASISLLQVAKGSAEIYREKGIMLWDVAAGLAIVEGANGVVQLEQGRSEQTFDAMASNGRIADLRTPAKRA